MLRGMGLPIKEKGTEIEEEAPVREAPPVEEVPVEEDNLNEEKDGEKV